MDLAYFHGFYPSNPSNMWQKKGAKFNFTFYRTTITRNYKIAQKFGKFPKHGALPPIVAKILLLFF